MSSNKHNPIYELDNYVEYHFRYTEQLSDVIGQHEIELMQINADDDGDVLFQSDLAVNPRHREIVMW